MAAAKYGSRISSSSSWLGKYFDGVFANAALFHVPSQELPPVLLELHSTLKPGGVLFSSNPRGRNEEGWNSGRYGVYHDLESWSRYTSAAEFVELTHYYRPDGCHANSERLAQVGALKYIASVGTFQAISEARCKQE